MKRRRRAAEPPPQRVSQNRTRSNARRLTQVSGVRSTRVASGDVRVAVAAPERPIRTWVLRVGRWAARLGVVGLLAYAGLIGVQKLHDHATTSPRFEVRGLIYDPTPHVDDGRLRDLMAVTPGTNILSLDLSAMADRIAADPWVARATVVRVLPDTLKVEVTEHEAKAVLLAGGFYLVNDDGLPFKALGAGERNRLPVLSGVEPLALLRDPVRTKHRMQRALEVVEAYDRKERPRLGEVHVAEDGSVTLYTAELGSQLRVGRGAIGPALSRYDALRAALGADSEKLAVAHLDGSEAQGQARVVASFFESQALPSFVADADEQVQARAAALAEQENPAQAAREETRSRSRTSRLPRYE